MKWKITFYSVFVGLQKNIVGVRFVQVKRKERQELEEGDMKGSRPLMPPDEDDEGLLS